MPIRYINLGTAAQFFAQRHGYHYLLSGIILRMETQQTETYHTNQIGLRTAYTQLSYVAKSLLFSSVAIIVILSGLIGYSIKSQSTADQAMSENTAPVTVSSSSQNTLIDTENTSNQDGEPDLFTREAFEPGARFVFDAAQMSFSIPDSAVEVYRMPARNDGEVLYITMQDGAETSSIEMATKHVYDEWNDGLPFEKLESETVMMDDTPFELRIYRVLQPDYSGERTVEREYFTVAQVFFDEPITNATKSGRVLYASYETPEQKARVRNFIESISFRN